MAYEKRERYVIRNNDDIKEELLDVLINVNNVASTKARQLVFYSKPLTLVRWSAYLTPAQMTKYLVAESELGSNIKDIDEDEAFDVDNMGI